MGHWKYTLTYKSMSQSTRAFAIFSSDIVCDVIEIVIGKSALFMMDGGRALARHMQL